MDLVFESNRKNIRKIIFLKDVLILTFSAFGGPQAHVAMMFRIFVDKRKYLSEEELIELNALCQILPGPTSTQTITAVGFRIGGVFLALVTLFLWILPAVAFMTFIAIGIDFYAKNNLSLEFTKYIQPMAIGFIAYAAYSISVKVIKAKTEVIIMISAVLLSYFFRYAWLFPIILILGGFITGREYKKHHREERNTLKIKWRHLVVFVSIFLVSAIATGFTSNIFVHLFENFYRNGSLIFGGGQVLIPMIYTEFVEVKEYLTREEFLSGFTMVQALPGPVFSFVAYIGALSASHFGHGTFGVIMGALVASIAIFTPGTLLIFFVIQIWDELKKIRIVKASISGVNASASGMVIGAAFILFESLIKYQSSLQEMFLSFAIVLATFLLLNFTRIPAPIIVLAGLGLGFLI